MLYKTLPKLSLQEEFGQTSKHETKRVLSFTTQTYVEVLKLFPNSACYLSGTL